jgi:KaiC/GvpD/RAD55 family RecA-like ATPase
MSAWDKLLEHPHHCGHFVQLHHRNDRALIRNVGVYLSQGLKQGEGVLVIATPEHREQFRLEMERSGDALPAAIRNGQCVFLDAHETLSQFMRRGQPDWDRFERVIREAVRPLAPGRLRAYGEMVGILWKLRRFAAAERLEQFWNRLMAQTSFSLYCAYEIDIFGRNFRAEMVEPVLCTHTHLIPAETGGRLEASFQRAVEDILGSAAQDLRQRIRATRRSGWGVLPNTEESLLWLRRNLPAYADDVAAQCRKHYFQSTVAPDAN